MDKHTERRHYLNTPVTARYVRFHPVSWHRKIGLRAGVIGCRYNGNCGAGFMQVNSGSSCSKLLKDSKQYIREPMYNMGTHEFFLLSN